MKEIKRKNDKKHIYRILLVFAALISIIIFYKSNNTQNLPVIAVANYGPHPSLTDTIEGMEIQLKEEGFVENKNIKYEIKDVNFNTSLIPQMITKLTSDKPKVLVVLSTPIAQFAKNSVHDIPVVYMDVTDPVSAGLLKEPNISGQNITGSSEEANFVILLQFAKKLLPHAKTVGVLYSTSESNDAAMVKMLKDAAIKENMNVIDIGIDESRDISTRILAFKNKVDFIYVGTSGVIQPALPLITSEAAQMHIPIFNADENEVISGLALASFGVNYKRIGANGGKLIAAILRGTPVKELKPAYPTSDDHKAFINLKVAESLGIKIPNDLKNVNIVE